MVDIATPGISKKANPALTADRNVTQVFGFKPRAARRSDTSRIRTDETLELYAVPTANPGTSKKLNGSLVAGGDVCRFKFSPDSKRVAYCADRGRRRGAELYTGGTRAPGPVREGEPAAGERGKVTTGYEFSPDTTAIIYAANQESATRTDLFRADLATLGSAAS